MNHKMNELLNHVWIRNLRHPVEIRKFFAIVAIHPVLYSPVSRVSKKISFKDNMECIAILRHSWMIHDTFWRNQIGRKSYFWTKSNANKGGSVMKCITLKVILLTIFLEVYSFFALVNRKFVLQITHISLKVPSGNVFFGLHRYQTFTWYQIAM